VGKIFLLIIAFEFAAAALGYFYDGQYRLGIYSAAAAVLNVAVAF